MLRHKQFLIDVSRDLEPDYFSASGGDSSHVLLFSVIRDYFKQYGTSPDWGTINAQVSAAVKRFFTDQRDPTILLIYNGMARIMKAEADYDERSVSLAYDFRNQMVKKCRFDVQVQEAIQGAVVSNQLAGLGQVLVEFELKAKALTGGLSISGDDLDITEEERPVRLAMGIPWFDKLFGDGQGLMVGSGVGICAPSGMGKSTFGYQVGAAMALQGKHVLYAIFEEGATGSVKRCLRSAITGIPTTTFAKCNDDCQKAAELEGLSADMVAEKVKLQKKYIHVMDMTVIPGTFDAIEGEVRSLTQRDMAPSIIYIDYAGLVAKRLMNDAVAKRVKLDMEPAMREVALLTNDLAKRYNLIAYIATQMAGSAIEKGASASVDMMASQGAKLFPEAMKYFLTISPFDKKTGLQTLRVGKARNDPKEKEVILKMDGAGVGFNESTTHDLRHGRYYPRTAPARVPQEEANGSKRNNSKVEG
jgi:hypothetical protein